MALSASSLAPRRITMSLTNEEQQQQNSLAKVKLAVDTVFATMATD
jgi:hypothetical protein